MKLQFSQQIFEKYSDIKLHENLYIGSRVVSCGRTDMTKLLVLFFVILRTHLKMPEILSSVMCIIRGTCLFALSIAGVLASKTESLFLEVI